MSFQRMLMMAAREPRPYLPHPEALVCLYVPRWQEEHGNTLTDWSGNRRNMTATGGALTWIADGVQQTRSTRLQWRGNAGILQDFTVIADRDATIDAGLRSYGLAINYTTTIVNVVTERHTAGQPAIAIQCASNGVYSSNMPIAPDGWIFQRPTDYCGTTIPRGTEYRTDYGISAVRLEPMWLTIRVIAVWRLTLTNKEIQIAQRYLDTASLEDYMMSRL